MLLTLNARSSLGKVAALAANTTPVDGVVVAGTLPVGLPAVNKVPVASSLMVAVPVAVWLAALDVAVSVKVSPLSAVLSLVIGERTNSVPVPSMLTLPLT